MGLLHCTLNCTNYLAVYCLYIILLECMPRNRTTYMHNGITIPDCMMMYHAGYSEQLYCYTHI